MSKIYTKKGDTGETGLIGGSRASKDETIFEVLGSIDELNAAIGVARTAGVDSQFDDTLKRIQHLLFEVGTEVASSKTGENRIQAELGSIVGDLEQSMDQQGNTLPELKNFILPAGCEYAAHLHLVRAIARRAERDLVAASKNLELRPDILAFMNRLSDWLFIAARAANHTAGRDDVIWQKGGKS
jgi:cob(I)alamin adenosyltransferase